MINGKLVRVNELQHITSKGYIAKIYSDVKLPSEWDSILADFHTSIRASLMEAKISDEIQLLQHNSTNRGMFSIPHCTTYNSLNSIMTFCVQFCEKYQKTGKNVNFFVGRMDLEQAFLAYASYQQDSDESVRT